MKLRNIAGIVSAIAALSALTACSDKEYEPNTAAEGAISFGATVPRASRSTSTTTTTIKQFTVYAFTNGKPYMENVKVTRSGAGWVYSPVSYWPSTPVNFYAYSPDISNAPAVDGSTAGQIKDYSNSGSVDLLYAVNMGEMAKTSPVMMNFRHAMSKVNVMLSSQNPAITVKVGHVSLNNVNFKGTFTFPQATTSQSAPANTGSWSDQKQPIDILTFYAIEETDAYTLTSTPRDLTEGNLNIDYMIPQPLTALDISGTEYIGNSIQIDCEIFDTATGAKIWPNATTSSAQLIPETGYGRLLFPVTTETVKEWEIGHAYIYNIQIDNPDELKPINFGVTVDEYIIQPTE